MTKEAVRYWSSKQAQNFPYSLQIEGEEWDLLFHYQVPHGVGKWLHEQRLIPHTGNLLDIGAGPSTTDVFGIENAHRSFAVDVSPYLLGNNRVPQKNKIYANIGTDSLPSNLHNNIGLAIMCRCSRYLDAKEKRHAASELFSVLQTNGTFVMIDITSSAFDKKVGETGPFDAEKEIKILLDEGFKDPIRTSCNIEVQDDKFGKQDYVLHQAVIVRKP
jgi:hypothetical protein